MPEMWQRNKVAIFVPSMRGGGAERVMATLANEFVAMGHDVDLVLAQREGPYLSEISAEVNIVDLRAARIALALIPLARYLRNQAPDSLLTALNHANLIALGACRISKRPRRVVISERADPTIGADGGQMKRYFLMLMRYFYRDADAIIAVSEGISEKLIREFSLSPSLVHAIPNPLRIDHIVKLSRERNDHPWLNLKGHTVYLAAGRLNPVKDYDTLLRAFGRVRERRPAKLIILGEGPLRARLTALASELGVNEDIDLVGFQANPFTWMANCDVFVLSSRTEGLPNSLLQAMACGARIVSTDCDFGPRELLEDGKWGQLVPVGDVAALYVAMERMADLRVAPNVRHRASQFDSSDVARRYGRLLALGGLQEASGS